MNNKMYKVVDAKVNKKLIGDELKLKAIEHERPFRKKKTGGGGEHGDSPRTPKPPRMTVQDLANLILPRLDSLDNRMTSVETTLKEHTAILEKHGVILGEHAEFNVIVKDYMDTHK